MESYIAAIIVAIITGLFSFAGVYISNRKSSALIDYRLKKVEERLDDFNHFNDRLVKLETFRTLQEDRNKTILNQLDELKKEGTSNGC